MKQKPVYILNHASGRGSPGVSLQTLDEVEKENRQHWGGRSTRGAGITANDLSFENMYDGFSLFHQFHLEGLGYRGIKIWRGSGLLPNGYQY